MGKIGLYQAQQIPNENLCFVTDYLCDEEENNEMCLKQQMTNLEQIEELKVVFFYLYFPKWKIW